MYTYKCEKCGKEQEIDEILENAICMQITEIKSVSGDEKRYGESPLVYCRGKLYRVYKPPTIVIKGVR